MVPAFIGGTHEKVARKGMFSLKLFQVSHCVWTMAIYDSLKFL